MASNLVYFWYRLVINHVRTIEEVPEKYRPEVEALIEEDS